MSSRFSCISRLSLAGALALVLVSPGFCQIHFNPLTGPLPLPPGINPPGPNIPVNVPPPVQQALNQAANSATNAATATTNALVAPSGQIFKVIFNGESLGNAYQSIVQSQGEQITAIGQAVSETSAAENNIQIIAAQSIGGDVGKTVMTIATEPKALSVEFAATSAIASGKVIGGKLRPEELIAAPLAAAIRAAEKQFEPQAKPIPPNVRAQLAGFFPADVLDAARWTIGSISISVPDVTNQFVKTFQGFDNAVTVGHITVFIRDPGDNYHWWAHELQHQVQYKTWRGGIDEFAYRYVTSCHNVEDEAETQAEKAVPWGRTPLSC
jgi:hypothetical protein